MFYLVGKSGDFIITQIKQSNCGIVVNALFLLFATSGKVINHGAESSAHTFGITIFNKFSGFISVQNRKGIDVNIVFEMMAEDFL